MFVTLLIAISFCYINLSNSILHKDHEKISNNIDNLNLVPPVINLHPIINPHLYSTFEIELIHQEIYDACKKWGFFHITNYSIHNNLEIKLFQQLLLFFNSSYDIKDSVRRSLDNSRGYADVELTKRKLDLKEVFDMGGYPYSNLSDEAKKNQDIDGYNRWPNIESYTHLHDFRIIVEEYYQECVNLSKILLNIMTSFFNDDNNNNNNHNINSTEIFKQHSSFMRLNYYPFSNITTTHTANITDAIHNNNNNNNNNNNLDINESFGVSRHTDAGIFTILLQHLNQPGLQVYSGSKQDNNDGEWIPVDPVEHALTINIGDMMQVWTNGIFKAAEHRVLASKDGHGRYSVPFFFNPPYDTIVQPLTTSILSTIYQNNIDISNNNNIDIDLIELKKYSKYDHIRWGDYRLMRFKGDVIDIGEEIQIEQFQHL